jgi:hypothetical protein
VICLQYGFDRASNLFELSAAGTRFVVIADAFVMHDEFKSEQTTVSNWIQFQANKPRFVAFIEDLNRKYKTNITLGDE